MALQYPLLIRCSTPGLREGSHPPVPPMSPSFLPLYPENHRRCFMPSFSLRSRYKHLSATEQKVRGSRAVDGDVGSDDEQGKDERNTHESKDDDGPWLMTDEDRMEWRKKIWEVMDNNPEVDEETDPAQRKIKMQKLLAEYLLVVEEDDPDWPEDADGWGFNFDQFFNKITIKNVKKDDEDDEGDKEVVWQDDNYIRPIRDITASDWEDTVFKDFNPLVILVHNRPQENEKARIELERAVQMFWETGLPSPRCVAVDAVVEEEIVDAPRISAFPEILFTKAGKILHRDKVVRTADEWSKIMAFFYYKAVRPPCVDKTDGQIQEKIPSLS